MSEIQPSLGELEDAQNTAYENFFTARDAVTAAGERVANIPVWRGWGKGCRPPMKRYVWQRKSI